jgi:hypothetical protein
MVMNGLIGKVSVLALLGFMFIYPVYGQSVEMSADSFKKISRRFEIYPIVRDTSLKYPGVLEVSGEIMEVCPGTYCGVICDCGTIKIKPDKKDILYPDSFIYVAIACEGLPKSTLHKKIKIHLEVLEVDNSDCFWKTGLNQINSGKTPFYIPRGEKWELSDK